MTSAEVLYKLVRVALGHESDYSLPAGADWDEIIDLSVTQGVSGLASDGLQTITDSGFDIGSILTNLEQGEQIYSWFAMTWTCERKYDSHLKTIADLAAFYHSHGVDMMLLKGYGLSLNYPVPSHRYPGDIDIYLWDDWEMADHLIGDSLGIKVNNSHHHHSVFHYQGVMVENHYDFVNAHSHASSPKIEAYFKSLAADKSQAVPCELPGGVKVYLPSPDLNALFVMRHNSIHFAADGIKLRPVLDWALFVEKHHTEVNWDNFWVKCKEMGMLKFALSINEIAVSRFGFDPAIFHTPAGLVPRASLVDRVLGDIVSPEFTEKSGRGVIKYIASRFRKWWSARWKHRIVYSDTLASTFFVQVWSHLMKPSTLKNPKD